MKIAIKEFGISFRADRLGMVVILGTFAKLRKPTINFIDYILITNLMH